MTDREKNQEASIRWAKFCLDRLDRFYKNTATQFVGGVIGSPGNEEKIDAITEYAYGDIAGALINKIKWYGDDLVVADQIAARELLGLSKKIDGGLASEVLFTLDRAINSIRGTLIGGGFICESTNGWSRAIGEAAARKANNYILEPIENAASALREAGVVACAPTATGKDSR